MYVSPAELLTSIGKLELATICTGKLGKAVNADVLELVVSSGDTSPYNSQEVAAAQSALELIEKKIAEQGYLMDAYIQKDQTLPLSADVIATSPLPGIATKLVHFELMLSASESVKDSQKQALQQLRDIANGVISLGVNDTTSTPSSNRAVSAKITAPSITDGFC